MAPSEGSRLRVVARGAGGFLLGYLIFAASAAALFLGMGIDPHSDPALSVKALSTVVGVLGGAIGAFVASRIGSSRWSGFALAILVAVAAIVSLLTRPGGGAIWSQLVALFLIAPTAAAAAVKGEREKG